MYNFTQTWFNDNPRQFWEWLIPQMNLYSALEIGSYEGNSACFLLETCPNLTLLTCIDTWSGGIEHQEMGIDMTKVFDRFKHNINYAQQLRHNRGWPSCKVEIFRNQSAPQLASLLTENRQYHLAYVDGSHQAPDVLCDLVLSWRLLVRGGVLIADDYPWKEATPADILRCPKPAIDAFTQIHFNQLEYIRGPIWQMYLQKT